MKTVKVTITGDIQVIDYASTTLYNEEENFNSFFYMMFHWERLESMTIDDGEENVIKKKGKYVKTKEYLHDKFKEYGHIIIKFKCAPEAVLFEDDYYIYKNLGGYKHIWRINYGDTKDLILNEKYIEI